MGLLKRQIDAVAGDRGLHKSVLGAVCRSIQPILLNVISVPAMAYIIRKLGAANYGYWSIATALIATTSVLTSLGLRGTFIRAAAIPGMVVAVAFADQLGTRVMLGLLAAGITILVCLTLRYPTVVIECTLVACIGMLFTTIATTGSDLLESFQRLPATAVVAMTAGLALTAASVIAMWLGAGPVGLSLSYLLGPAISAVMMLQIVRKTHCPIRAEVNPPRTAHLLWQSRHFTIQQLLSVVSTNIALLMLPPLVGAAQFGLFSAGVLLITRLAIFPDAIGTAFYPLLSKSKTADYPVSRRHALLGIALAVATCVAVALPTTLLAGWIAHVLFPKSPAECQRVIAITIWALPLIGIETMMTYTSNAAGREAAQARASFFGTLAGLTAGMILVLGWKLEGACWFMLIRSFLQICFIAPVFLAALGVRSVSRRIPPATESFDKVAVGVQR